MRTALALALVVSFVASACVNTESCFALAACAGTARPETSSPARVVLTSPIASASPEPTPTPVPVAALTAQIDTNKLNDHLVALTSVVSRDVHHPGHAKALAYLKEQLGAMGVQVESYRNVYQGIALESLLVTIDPLNAPPTAGWVMICAHYDSISNRSPNWNPSTTAAPGADDNATGTAALLEYARILSQNRASLTHRVVLAFFDGEELFFKGQRRVRHDVDQAVSVQRGHQHRHGRIQSRSPTGSISSGIRMARPGCATEWPRPTTGTRSGSTR